MNLRTWRDFQSYCDFEGLRSRRDYILGLTILWVSVFIVFTISYHLLALINYITAFTIFFIVFGIIFSIAFGAGMVLTWCSASLTVQRLRHIGMVSKSRIALLTFLTILFPFMMIIWSWTPGAILVYQEVK